MGLLVLLLAAAARAEVVPLTVQPAAAPVPALKYQLLPELRIQKADNAAPIYVRAQKALKKIGDWQTDAELLGKWCQLPADRMIKDNVREVLAPYQEVFDLLDQAGCCETCDFKLSDRMRKYGIGATLPEIQDMRPFANLLAIRARLELLEDRPDQALRILRTGLAMARHTGNQPCLVCSLVGVAVSTVFLNEIPNLIQHPRCPNLYWSLNDLPAPFLDYRVGLEGERLSIYSTFPGLASQLTNLDAGPMTAEQVQELVKSYIANTRDSENTLLLQAQVGYLLSTRHEKAKKALIAQGRPRDKVEAMPHIQVGMLHGFLEYDRHFDELLKWQAQPYWQSASRPEELDRKLRREAYHPDAPALPLAQQLLPAIRKVLYDRARLDRQIAQLRCLEAIRLYTAAHEGSWPVRLTDISEAPVPVDPATGQPFIYQVTGDSATLSCPQAAFLPGQDQKLAKSYVLRKKSG